MATATPTQPTTRQNDAVAAAPMVPAAVVARATPAQRVRNVRVDHAHIIVARVALAATGLQILFAGIGIFTHVGFLPHAILAPIIILGSLSLPILAQVGHLDRHIVKLSWLLFALMMLQGLLIDAGRLLLPAISSLHPVNAMLLVLILFELARRDQ